MLTDESRDARLEELEARVEAQAGQLRLLWAGVLYGLATLAMIPIYPELGQFLGLAGVLCVSLLALVHAR